MPALIRNELLNNTVVQSEITLQRSSRKDALQDKLQTALLWHGRKLAEVTGPRTATTLIGKGIEFLVRLVKRIALQILLGPVFFAINHLNEWLIQKTPKPEPIKPFPKPQPIVPSPVVPPVLPPEGGNPSTPPILWPVSPIEVTPATPEVDLELKQTLLDIITDFENQYTAILSNLELIESYDQEVLDENGASSSNSPAISRENHGSILLRTMQHFKETLEQYHGPHKFSKALDTIVNIEETLPHLKKVYVNYKEIMSNYHQSFDADQDGIIKVPGDGNCWLHSALYLLRDMNRDRGYTHVTLREAVVDWMEARYDHDDDLKLFIANAIMDYVDDKMRLLNQESDSYESMRDLDEPPTEEYIQANIQRIENERHALDQFGVPEYFASMRQIGFFGSRAELYAISNIFKVDVSIWRVIGGKVTRNDNFDPPIESIQNQGMIDVVFDNKHFNPRLPSPR